MSLAHRILMRMFGHPTGLLRRLGGIVMARTNQPCAAWVIDRLGIQPHDRVLEVGCGPGVGIELLSTSVSGGYIAAVDPSAEMVEQARARTVQAMESPRVDLRYGAVERLPVADHTFTKALAMHVWPDAMAGLRDMRRVMEPGGSMALGFTSYSGQSKSGRSEMLTAAGLTEAHVVEAEAGCCALTITA